MSFHPAVGWIRTLAGRLRSRPVDENSAAETPLHGKEEATIFAERYSLSLADLDSEALRDLISDLNGRSDEVGCAIFRPPGVHERVVVIFAGSLEHFFMLAAARKLSCPVIILQDPFSHWYQGSRLLPDLNEICRRIVIPEVGAARALLFGQSSGAYAALAAAAYLSGATVLACAPQTFSDARAKDRIRFVGVRALRTPENLIDLRAHLSSHPDPASVRAVVIAAGELDNPASAHWWGDYLHLLHLADVPNLHLFVVNANMHVLAHRRVNQFANLLHQLVTEPADQDLMLLENFLIANYDVPSG